MKNKDSINYMLVNCTFFVFIIYLLSKLNILNKLLEIFILIFLSIVLSYIIYPIYKELNKFINNIYSLIIIYILLLIFILLLIYLIIPNTNLLLKIIDLFDNLITFIEKINIKYSLNINVNKYINEIINNGVFYLKNIINYVSKFFFMIVISISILLNINIIKKIINKFKYKTLLYNINSKLKNYLIANIKIITIQFIEYTIIFNIIGHPNYLLLGILNSLNTFIPIFGSIISNIIAITTASVINKNLLISTSIICIIFPNIDAYVITPKIYKKENELPQTLSITSIIIGTILFGFYGLLFSIPILIIIIEIINYKNNAKSK